MPQMMYEIGTKFLYAPTEDNDDLEGDGIGDEECIVLGYVYYDGDLFYTCLGTESEMQFDMYNTSVTTRLLENQDES